MPFFVVRCKFDQPSCSRIFLMGEVRLTPHQRRFSEQAFNHFNCDDGGATMEGGAVVFAEGGVKLHDRQRRDAAGVRIIAMRNSPARPLGR